MSQSAKELLIIYETEAEEWAVYLQSVFTGPISESGICRYDIAQVSSRQDDFINLSQYTCKLLILSKGMIEALSQRLRFFLARVLSPAACVVVLLCGVESLTPLLEMVPLNGNKCLQVSSEQDVNEYLSAVTDIVRKGMSPTAANTNPSTWRSSGSEQTVEQMHSNEALNASTSIMVVPSRVPCGSSVEVFILLKNKAVGSNSELEFSGENHTLRVTPAHWNDQTLCVRAPDFPPGNVRVSVYSNGVALSTAQLQYYNSMEEFSHLLSRVVDPIEFMCQALQVSSVERLDQRLASMLLEARPTKRFQELQSQKRPERVLECEDLPSLLHFAAQFGFKSVCSLLLQCPGAERALHTANRHGHTPSEIAKKHGHTELHVLLKEKLNMSREDSSDASIYEIMCRPGRPSTTDAQKAQQGEEEEEGGEEDLYTPLGVNEEYDTIVKSAKALIIANRPPAPTPRPESTRVEDKTPYIAQVFQKKKMSQSDLYSLPTKQAQDREDSVPSTYDTFVPNQTLGLRVKVGSPPADEALERFSNWPHAQKSTNTIQQETLSQLRASSINSRDDGNSVYDKINIVHHSPCAVLNKKESRNKSVESDFYSTPLKGQHHFFWKADKQ